MNRIFSVILMWVIPFSAAAQGKYFEVICEKGSFGNELIGRIRPVNDKSYVILNYRGRTQKQLFKAIQSYLKNRPALKPDHIDSSEGAFIVYRDFATVCGKEKCFADLVALTFIYVSPENDGTVKINLGSTSHIYSTIFDAKLRISPDNIVASDDDVPFNEIRYVQPSDGRTQSNISPNGGLIGLATSRKKEYRLAYPDSIFSPDGELVNPVNKEAIEAFLDGYVTDLKTFLDNN